MKSARRLCLSLLAASFLLGPVTLKAITFSGQATGLRATVLGVNTSIADTGPLPSGGGSRDATVLSAAVPGLVTGEVFHATTVGQDDRARSEASVANVNLTVGGNTITAEFLMARAEAACPGPTLSGSSEIVSLVVNGQSIVVGTEPNQTILLPNGRIIVNEQIKSVDGRTGDITVNALHVIVDGTADVVVSSAHADVTCTGPPACDISKDFVTGGGWITGTPSGAKGTFAVAGGIKNGAFWGHLTFVDHGSNGPKVKGTGVTAYVIVNATTRHIEGTAEINGQGGFTYKVDVADNGEPGRNDTFNLSLSNGYTASGSLGGGNIQLHLPCR